MTIVLERIGAKSPRKEFVIDRTNQTWKQEIRLQHVSGDFFMAWADSTTAPGTPVLQKAMAAEFRIGPEGRPVAFGIGIEEAMKEEKIWFMRIV